MKPDETGKGRNPKLDNDSSGVSPDRPNKSLTKRAWWFVSARFGFVFGSARALCEQ
jgi:hypothetical protein